MIKKVILSLFIIVVVVSLVVFMVLKNKDTKDTKDDNSNIVVQELPENKLEDLENDNILPWIEVLVSAVNIQNSDGLKILESGDELENNSIIITDEFGLANIYFPDGSVVRLDSNTEIKLQVGDYNESDGGLMVKIGLTAGHVWSKILELTTPESYWEIETSNAVAAVRGTSFGVEYLNNSTKVLVSENLVSVVAKDIKSNNLENEVLVKGDHYISITPQTIKNINNKKINLEQEVKIISNNLISSNWVKGSVSTYDDVNKKLQNLKDQDYTNNEIRNIFKVDTANNRLKFLKSRISNKPQLKLENKTSEELSTLNLKEFPQVKIQPLTEAEDNTVLNGSGNAALDNPDNSADDTKETGTTSGDTSSAAGVDQTNASTRTYQPGANVVTDQHDSNTDNSTSFDTNQLSSLTNNVAEPTNDIATSINSQLQYIPLTISSSTLTNIQPATFVPVLNIVK